MAANIAFNNSSLVNMSLSLNQIITASIPVMTATVAVAVERQVPGRGEAAGLVVLTGGVMLSASRVQLFLVVKGHGVYVMVLLSSTLALCYNIVIVIIIITRFSCRRQGASADKLHVKAAKFLPLVGLARSKQDPINRVHNIVHYLLVIRVITRGRDQSIDSTFTVYCIFLGRHSVTLRCKARSCQEDS
ncbi:hypothetical protein COCSUDRAFT_45659 [Coccomyxa subellipsoidea C-169]|uniref:Uncharacterized protein n=1 Tax=Coccomyxa subellipsoidea (strain C-169) TaxID=574566 RepID=I0YI12_COCSC|nr:hypothetical protein COCSUDRAFT_45659 [Coccomyxa subellipsoidea C-169]EIE18031.1 hypothetical protein COCSUDRAFT_45659 [Coccomyxa subellipsoidea C-169]|eukprot:XP_005642575.1 hypothetical protein COCSUDRAFT_45659 [Coccomyxa subellipsoidea C-169]